MFYEFDTFKSFYKSKPLDLSDFTAKLTEEVSILSF